MSASDPAPATGLTRRVRVPAGHGTDGQATVAVVIPCYNYADYLPQAVASALDQQGVRVEVIVVDDASTDDSLAAAQRLAAADPRVQVLAHARNAGPVQTFNDGLARAEGEFVVRLDADDLLTPGSLRRSVDLLRAYPSVGLVYGHPVHFEGADLPEPRSTARVWTVWPGQEWIAARCRSGYNVITSPEVMMRRSVVRRVGGQLPLAHTHDMEMWLRVAAFSDVAHIQGADQAWHRDHPASLSARHVDYLTDVRGRLDAFDALFDGVAAHVLPVTALRDLTHRVLAEEALEFCCHQYDRGRDVPQVTEALLEFSQAVYPPAASLPGWRALARRRSISALPAHRRPWYQAQALRRRWRQDRRYRHWTRWGVYSDA